MNRSVKLSLKYATKDKQQRISALLREYKKSTKFFIGLAWREKINLDAVTLRKYAVGRLGYRQISDCLSIALDTVIATRKSAKALKVKAAKPCVPKSIRVSALCAKVEEYKKDGFDYCVKLSCLVKGKPIILPLKATRVLRKWLAVPGAKLLQGCVILKDSIQLCVRLPDLATKEEGLELGLDAGLKKTLATSDGKTYGLEYRKHVASINRKLKGSKGRKRAYAARSNFLNKTVKELPWSSLKMLAVEDLAGLKKNAQKKNKSSKKTRKAMAPWVYRQVLNRIELLAQENRVRLVYVNPRNTSRRCPHCGWVAKENRSVESFRCVNCNYSADADINGAVNILAKADGTWQADMVPASLYDRVLNVAI